MLRLLFVFVIFTLFYLNELYSKMSNLNVSFIQIQVCDLSPTATIVATVDSCHFDVTISIFLLPYIHLNNHEGL